jgi:IS30 family transposase
MDIQKVVKMYNENKMTLEQIGKELNTSKTTLSRVLKNNGWVLDKTVKQYTCKSVNTENNISLETINTGNNIKNKTVNTVKCTFDLPIDLVTALKVKSSVERVKMVKILEKTLRDSIESKYFIK